MTIARLFDRFIDYYDVYFKFEYAKMLTLQSAVNDE